MKTRIVKALFMKTRIMKTIIMKTIIVEMGHRDGGPVHLIKIYPSSFQKKTYALALHWLVVGTISGITY